MSRNTGRPTEKIYCIGDSHVSFFSGTNQIQPLWPKSGGDVISIFKTFRLGAVLAYNLCEYGTSWKGRELLSILLDRRIADEERIIPLESRILLCFGEIDCRAHLLRQQQSQNKPISTVVQECVDRYFSVIKESKELGYRVIVWNVIPSTRNEKIANKEFPVFGTCAERNQVTRLFNKSLQEKCEAESILFISIFDPLIDADGLTNMDFYKDPIHLSQKAMPLALDEMRKKLGSGVVYEGLENEIAQAQRLKKIKERFSIPSVFKR